MEISHFEQQIARLCKPPGSLGAIERVAARLCEIQRTSHPQTHPRHVTIFAADHGITAEGVSAWPQSVTASVVKLMRQQKTASGVFAHQLQASYEVVDVGLAQSFALLDTDSNAAKQPNSNILSYSIRGGTRNFRYGPAMSGVEFDRAWMVGSTRARIASEANQVLIGGEMGIGNTTSASCLACLLANFDPDEAVGRGAGIDDEGLIRKRSIVSEIVARVRRAKVVDPKSIACEVGGFEIVALAGYYATAAQLERTLILDGFIATTAALLAEQISPGTLKFMIAAHCSAERAHQKLLQHIRQEPLLNLGCRLGEASGALLGLPLLDLAAAMINGMATLEELEL